MPSKSGPEVSKPRGPELLVPRILFIDAFDSFSNNIIGLLEQSLKADVTRIFINDEAARLAFPELLRNFDGVVIGPGPGHPAIPNDVGLINELWKLSGADMIPILGICLGFQCLCLENGAEVSELKSPRHGIISPIAHNGANIFDNVEGLSATNYHSLHVKLDQEGVFWEPTNKCPSLRPLAWDLSDSVNGPILMAACHTTKPFWGVQFHPESICTTPEAGRQLIRNWWRHAADWLLLTKRGFSEPPHKSISSDNLEVNGQIEPRLAAKSHLADHLRSVIDEEDVTLRWGMHQGINVSATDLVDRLGLRPSQVLVLDAQGHERGKYSIIGLVMPEKTMHVTYKVSDRVLQYGFEGSQRFSLPMQSIDDVWPFLQEALDNHTPKYRESAVKSDESCTDSSGLGLDPLIKGLSPDGSPFWGGFMGYISYEAGLETIRVDAFPSEGSQAPDIHFAFAHRSIVIDHDEKEPRVYVQSLLPDDWSWILKIGGAVDGMRSQFEARNEFEATPGGKARPATKGVIPTVLTNARVARPKESPYRQKVLDCQDFLLSGNSYELCLTDETRITVPVTDEPDSWMLYKHLRTKNPAPFGAYMDFAEATILSCSPERFLNWTREGKCQYRPIKGTVKKGPGMTEEKAIEILSSSKEQAENLMIVDLIRHDLCGIVGPEKSCVSKLMGIEEYETVWQLVSVIEGELDGSQEQGPRGLDVLSASLPPGSMTGAPKKRSCEILRDIERRRRGVYSGVLGYLDVGGGGDFSVVIRTAVRRNDEDVSRVNGMYTNGIETNRTETNGTNGYANGNHDERDGSRLNGAFNTMSNDRVWAIGAGGAVTVQSTDEGEFLEMEAKQTSVLNSIL